MLLNELLHAHASLCPEQPAVIHHRQRLSYSELDRLSDTFAACLVAAGVRAGDRVGLLAENSADFVVAYFAVLKSSAVVVAMATSLTPREIAAIVNDCRPKILLAAKSFADIARAAVCGLASAPLVIVTDTESIALMAPLSPPALAVMETGVASIIYTSGTTGAPKGVMLSHRNITANARSIVDYLRLTPRDRVLAVLPFCYSYGASLLTTHIMAGGTLVIDNRFLFPSMVLDTMAEERVTGFAGVPSTYAILLRKAALRNYWFPRLRYVTQAGGALRPEMIDEFQRFFPDVAFYVMYGQTEATARLSYLEPSMLARKRGSIGRAIPGVELTVIDKAGRPVAPGTVGEITACGDNIMQGYWNAPDETGKVLKDGRLFTGDLARVDEDGFIYIVGRKKEIIKTGSYRVSPHEIEDVAGAMPGISECVAVGFPDDIMGEAVVLFVVPDEGVSLKPSDIIAYCRTRFPSHKVPKRVTIVASLPKTISGKVKRGMLREVYASA